MTLPDAYLSGAPVRRGHCSRLAITRHRLVESEGAGRLPVAGAPAPEAVEGKPARRLRILIIDDNRDFAEALQMFFELHGHDAVAAFSGTEGVQAALVSPPDAVICDLGLPELNGFEVVTELRARAATANVRIIAVTGYGDDDDRRRTAAAGFDAHLVKPVEGSEILAVLLRPMQLPN